MHGELGKKRRKRLLAIPAAVLALFCACFLCGGTPGNGVYLEKELPAAEGKLLALTFDDGPGKYTDALLDILEENQAKATFFVLGKKVEKYAPTLQRMAAQGHLIGNHTYNHSRLLLQSKQQVLTELEKTDAALQAIGLPATEYFRPTYGHYTNYMAGYVDKITVTWSYDTIDWKAKDTQLIYQRVMAHAKDGEILLLHDVHKTTVEAMRRAIPDLIAQGYQLVTVEELLMRGGGALEQGMGYRACREGKQPSYFVFPVVVNL